jgi:hypothetical protein
MTEHPLEPSTQLSFQLMNQMLDEYAKNESGKAAGPVERWAFCIGLLGAALGMLFGTLLGNALGLQIARIGLVVELAGLSLSLVLTTVREWNNFRHARRTYAFQLDHDYGFYREYVAKLRKFPLHEREARLRYIQGRKQHMVQRLGLFTGGIEKLGVIPLLLGLYLQFKDWRWGDWEALAQVNLVQGLLMWALFLCYAAGWYLIGLRSRVDAYELLLAEANQDRRPA